MKILTDTGLMVLWQRIKDLYKKISVSAKQTTISTEDGGTNVMTFTFGDGTSTTLSVKNGSKGSDGAKGETGAKGEKGDRGDAGERGPQGEQGIQGPAGPKGDKGDAFTYNDFTEDQLAALKGPKGDRGPVGETGPQGNSGIADASNKALINDAVTGGETSYLSAEVGKLGILTYDCSKGGTVEHASLQDAINAVPTTFRKVGITIIYKSGDSIYRYALKSNSWSTDSTNWFSVEEKVENVMPYALLPYDAVDEFIQIDFPAKKVKVASGSYFIIKNRMPYSSLVSSADTQEVGAYETDFICEAPNNSEEHVWMLAYKVEDSKLYYIHYASIPQQMDEEGNVLWYPLAYCNYVDGQFHTNFQGTLYYNGVRYSNTMRDFGNMGGWFPLWQNGAPTMKDSITVLMPSSFAMYNYARRNVVQVYFDKTENDPAWENYYGVRHYLESEREITISTQENKTSGFYFIAKKSYNDDYSTVPLVVRNYSDSDLSSILPPTDYGEYSLLGLYKNGRLTTTTATTTTTTDWIEPQSMSFSGLDPKSTIRIDVEAKKVYCTKGNKIFLTNKSGEYIARTFSDDNIETDILLYSDGGTFTEKQLWYLLFTDEDNKVYLVNFNRIPYFFRAVKDGGLGYDRTKTYLLGAGTFESATTVTVGAGTFRAIGPFMCNGIQYYPSAMDINEEIQGVPTKKFPFVNKLSDNLFNPYTVYAGYSSDGLNFTPNDFFWTSDYIEVTPGKKYKRNMSKDKWVYAYDKDKQPVQVVKTEGKADGYAWSGDQFEALESIPDGIKYVRCIINPSDINQFMFGLSTADFNSYIPYHKVLFDIQYDPLVDINYTDNLFNKDDVTYNGYWGDSGKTWTPSTAFNSTGFIPVVGGQTYKSVAMITTGYVYPYDENKNPVQLEDGKYYWKPLDAQFTVPSGLKIAYLRIVFSVSDDVNAIMFGLSTVDFSSYIPYSRTIKIKNEYLPATASIAVGNALYGKSAVGNLQYEEIGEADYNQIILYGQSLSMGWECPEVITATPINGNYMVGNNPLINHGNNHDETLHPLIAVKWSGGGEQPIVGCVNSFSKLYRRFVNKSQMFIGSSAGEGGQSIERLSKECTNVSGSVVDNNYYHIEFLRLLDQTKAAVDAESKTVNCSAILYMQGEHNYTGSGLGMTPGTEATKDKDEYKTLLMTLKNNMQADIMEKYGQTQKPLFFIYETAGVYINNKEMTINMAQIEFAQENDDVFLLHPTYPTPDYNGGHLSTNGYRWYGELMAKSLYDVLVRGEHYKPVFPTNYTINKNQLIIDFYVPVPPLVLDTWTKETITNMGFIVYNNSTEISITDVTVKSTSVVLTCASELSGIVEVIYAGQGRSGSGNLRDSDTYRSYYSYFDDRKTAPSKRENYTPRDQKGKYIYSKPYPMYNWCVNFYKKI